MKRKLVCLLLCLSFLLACIPSVSAYSNVSDWAKEAVDAMYSLGFLPESLGTANMGRTITRGEMCKMAVLVYEHLNGGYAYPDSTKHFTDTNDPAICYAYEQGIISGYTDLTFRPNDPLTRQDFFKITHNLMGSAYCDTTDVPKASLERFQDAWQVSDYAVEPTQIMVSIGVVQGTGTSLEPKAYTTCEEAVLMFFRAYKYMGDWFNAQSEESKSILIRKEGYTSISTWAIREVQEMQSMGMIPSCLSNCNMSRGITRQEMCAIAVLAYNKATGSTYVPKKDNYFTDCSDPDINAAYELGIIEGYGNGLFGPFDTLTREQFFKIMANFMAALDYPRKDTNAVALSRFGDGSKVASWAKAPTRLLIYIGAVTGDGKNLNPQDNTAVQEAIAVFLRCYKYTIAWREEHPDGEVWEEPTLMEEMLAFAKSYVGYPYVYGGNGPNSFDCSGFVLYVYRHFGYSFSRGAQEQYEDGMKVDMSELKPGDLVFFSGNGYSITHVGLYLGNGSFIHAANPSRGVVIDNLWSGYYNKHFWGGCRIIME